VPESSSCFHSSIKYLFGKLHTVDIVAYFFQKINTSGKAF